MKKIKVLMPIEYYYPIGGIERFVTNLTNAFSDDLDIIWSVKKIGGNFDIDTPTKARYTELKHPIKDIWKQISKERPNVIFMNNAMFFNLLALIRARMLKIPVVYFCHQVPKYKTKGILAKIENFAIWTYLRIMVNYCTKFIVPSNAVKGEFTIRKFTKVPEVVYPGVDKTQFRPVSQVQKNALRSKYGHGEEEKIVCWVGRFSPEKRVKIALSAAKNYPDITFILAGFKPSASNNFNMLPWVMKNKSKNTKVITDAGPDVIQEIYQLSDVCISTSSYETFGSTISEAAACGITTVVPNHSGVAEAGREGYIYEYTQESLNKMILEALARPRLATEVVTNLDNAAELQKIFEQVVN